MSAESIRSVPQSESSATEQDNNPNEAVKTFRARQEKYHKLLKAAESLAEIRTIVSSFGVPLTVGGITEEHIWGEDSVHSSEDGVLHEIRRRADGFRGGTRLDDPSIAGGIPGKTLSEAVDRVLMLEKSKAETPA